MIHENKFNYLLDQLENITKDLEVRMSYLFSESRTPAEKRRFELNSLNNVLIRLLEDISLQKKGIKLIYVIDSSEFRGYVDPQEHVKRYIFKIKSDKPDDELLHKKAKWRKYRYQVLFGMKQKQAADSQRNLFHSLHIREIIAYKLYLLNGLFNHEIEKTLVEVIEEVEKGKLNKKQRIEHLIEKIKEEHKYVDVFKTFVKNTRLLDRFNNLIAHGNFSEVNKFDWSEITGENTELTKTLNKISYDKNLYQFLIEPLSAKLVDPNRKHSIKVDYKVLSYVCTVNQYLKNNNVNYRLALLSSSKLINLYSKYLTDFLSTVDDMNKTVTNYFKDIFYVRYPTILINDIKHTSGSWRIESEISTELLPVINGVLKQIRLGRNEADYQADLETIANKWESLRDNFMIEENIEDVQELAHSSEDEVIKSVEALGFEAIYKVVFRENKKIINDLVESYLVANAHRITDDFYAEIRRVKMLNREDTRYLLKSTSPLTSQYVFQVPTYFIKNNIIVQNSRSAKISFDWEKFEALKGSDKEYLYEYICILFSCILRDWKIVNTVSHSFIKRYKDKKDKKYCYLIEEVMYFLHLSMRYELFREISIRGIGKGTDYPNTKIQKIDKYLNEAIDSNKHNPRFLLCQLTFRLQKAVLAVYKIKYLEETPKQMNKHLKWILKEYEDNTFLEALKTNFERHCFRNNLFLMYHKVMLCIFLFCRTNRELPNISEKRALTYLNETKTYLAILHQYGSFHGTKFLVAATEQILSGQLDAAALEEAYKKLPRHSFLRGFIARPVKDYVGDLERAYLRL